MADNKRKRGKADRARVSASEGYEVAYYARKHGITPAAVRKLIKRVGNSRKKLDAALKRHAKADRARGCPRTSPMKSPISPASTA